MTVQVQHVDFYRKVLLRRYMLKHAVAGATYLPFVGDGDLAVEHYLGHQVFAADIDPARVQVAQPRVSGVVKVADCDLWPFPEVSAPFSVADFDAYNNPYFSFRAFWRHANKADRLVLFFTDGARLGMMRNSKWIGPDGSRVQCAKGNETTQAFQFYYARSVLPWFEDYIKPWRIVQHTRYLRSHMVYWSAVIEHDELPAS